MEVGSKVWMKLVSFCISGSICLARVVGATGWCAEVMDAFDSGQWLGSAMVEGEREVSRWQG